MIKAKLALFIFFICGTQFIIGQKVIEAIVAIVNDDVITLSDYKLQHDMLYKSLQQQLQGEEFDKRYEAARSELLETMITNMLLLQEADKKGLDVTEQINMMIEKIKTDNDLQSDEQLVVALQQQGIGFEMWKNEMESNYLREGVIFTEVSRNVVIDDAEIVNYHKQHPDEFVELPEYTLKAITISTEGKIDEEVDGQKKEIDGKLAAGEEFGKVSETYSDGPEKESQGDLGSYQQGQLNRTLEEAVESIRMGELTPWIKTPNAWILLRLEKLKESRIKSFDEVRDQIEQKLYNEQNQKKLLEFLENLKKRSFVKILIPDPLDFKL